MKKQFALIIISILAVMSVSAQNVNAKEMCSHSQRTPICQAGPGVIQPSLDEIFDTCIQCPDTDVRPELPEIPEKPEAPEEPVLPDIPEKPEVPEVPEIPEAPEVPEVPETPDNPEQAPDIEPDNPETSLALRVVTLVNAERAKYGLSALTYDGVLSRAANTRAVETKTYFSHTRPDGSSCFTALDEVGYSYRTAGENIAYGQKTAAEVMNAWMNSEGHRANILGQNYTHIGVGVYESGGVIYWSQFFAG